MNKFTAFFSILFAFFSSSGISQENILEQGTGKLNLLGCSNTSGVINITGTGNIQAHKAYFGSETTLDEINMDFNVLVDSLNGDGDFRFGIGKYSGLAGTLVEFAGTDSTSKIIISRLNGTTPVFITQFSLPFNLTIGTDYKIRVGKKIRQLVIDISSDEITNHFLYDSLSYPTPFFGCLWGTPFIGCVSGSISVSSFMLSTPLNLSPRLSVWGDSFVEGNSLDNVQERYVSLIKDSIGYQNVSILGRGGETSSSISTRIPKESSWFEGSKYALVAIGVNDLNFAIWKTNMLKHIDTLKKRGMIPIITTLTPRSDRLSFIAQANAWIRNTYNGAYIDLMKAVATSSETHWAADMALNDSIHPTVTGHQAMYDRIKREAPYIFRDSAAFTIDYFTEATNENVIPSLEYSTLSTFGTAESGNFLPVNLIPGETFFFRDTLETPGIHVIYDILPIPLRPAAPSGPDSDIADQSFDWINNPRFTDISDYEFSIDSGATWATCFQKPVISPGTTTVEVRIKADSSHFKSEPLFINMELPDQLAALQENNFRAYPNPFEDKLVVENISEGTIVSLYASDGRLLQTGISEAGPMVINTEELTAGLYVLTLRNESSASSLKIIKK